jgi:hypothetical protein
MIKESNRRLAKADLLVELVERFERLPEVFYDLEPKNVPGIEGDSFVFQNGPGGRAFQRSAPASRTASHGEPLTMYSIVTCSLFKIPAETDTLRHYEKFAPPDV